MKKLKDKNWFSLHKVIFILLLTIFCHQIVSSQINASDHDKYWYYRYRLVNEFLIRGEQPNSNCAEKNGLSLPAAEIYASDDILIRWGDCTVELGWYIGVLATEYSLLSSSGQNTQMTLQELYYAMKAYARVDKKAEYLAKLTTSSSCKLDGFFIRDDVGKEVFNFDNDFKKKYTNPNGTLGFASTAKDTTIPYSSYSFPSPDQVAALFVGFSLIKKCIPRNVQYNGYYFTDSAACYTSLITNRLISDLWFSLFYVYSGELDGVEDMPAFMIFHTSYKTVTSDDFFMNSWSIAKAAEYICRDTPYADNFQRNFGPSNNLKGFQELAWNVLGAAIYLNGIITETHEDGQVNIKINDNYRNTYIATLATVFNAVMANNTIQMKGYALKVMQSLAAIGNSWDIGPTENVYTLPTGIIIPCWDPPLFACMVYQDFYSYSFPFINFAPPIVLSPFPIDIPTLNYTANALSKYGDTFDQEIFPLLRQVLHGGNNNISMSEYQGIIKSAPGTGPYHYLQKDSTYAHRDCINAPLEGYAYWRANDKWSKPFHAQYGDSAASGAEWSGIDFMILYNLFWMQNKGNSSQISLSAYTNKLTVDVTGQKQNPENFISKEKLDFKNFSLLNNSSTSIQKSNYTAGKIIRLLPPSKIEKGALATLKIEKPQPNCTTPPLPSNTKMPSNEKDLHAYIPLDIYLKTSTNKVKSVSPNEKQVISYKTSFEIYPVPAQNIINIKFNSKKSEVISVTITNCMGNLLISKQEISSEGANIFSYDIKNLEDGFYSLSIKGKDFSISKPFVKNKIK